MGRYQSDSLFEGMDSRFRGNDIRGGNDKERDAGHIIRVAFESGVDNEFSYLMPDELWPIEVGQRVEVPFGKKNSDLPSS